MFAAIRVRVSTVVRSLVIAGVVYASVYMLITVLNTVVFAQPQAPFPGAVLIDGGWIPCDHPIAVAAGRGCGAGPVPTPPGPPAPGCDPMPNP